MPKGSVVIYLSSCLHGSGPNTSDAVERVGLNVSGASRALVSHLLCAAACA
jgi:ectoine hydroxylase-related dioxygenase (phytanoyl-CoA dioxygenase family)